MYVTFKQLETTIYSALVVHVFIITYLDQINYNDNVAYKSYLSDCHSSSIVIIILIMVCMNTWSNVIFL